MGLILGSALSGVGAGLNKHLDREFEREKMDRQRDDKFAAADYEAKLRKQQADEEDERPFKEAEKMKGAISALPPEEQAKLKEDPMAFADWAITNGFHKSGKLMVESGYRRALIQMSEEKAETESAKRLKLMAEAIGAARTKLHGKSAEELAKADLEWLYKQDGDPAKLATAIDFVKALPGKITGPRALHAAIKGEQLTSGAPALRANTDDGGYTRIEAPLSLGNQRVGGTAVGGSTLEKFVQSRLGKLNPDDPNSQVEMGAIAAQSNTPIGEVKDRFADRFQRKVPTAAPAPSPAPSPKAAPPTSSEDPLAGLSMEKARKLKEDMLEEIEDYGDDPNAKARIAELRSLISRIDRRDF